MSALGQEPTFAAQTVMSALPLKAGIQSVQSAAAFGNKFAGWCKQAGLKPAVCDDGQTRNYHAHGLRKTALTAPAHAGCTTQELMAVGGRGAHPQNSQKLKLWRDARYYAHPDAFIYDSE